MTYGRTFTAGTLTARPDDRALVDVVVGPSRKDAGMELSTVVQLASGAALGVLGDRLTLRREARNDQIALAREATSRLLPELRRLRDLARDSRHDELHPRAWAEAITGFTRAYDDFGHRLPDGWRHVQRSVRAAVGEFAGGVVDADLDKRMVDYPLPVHDHVWLNNAIDYLEYVIWKVQVWNDAPLSRQVQRLPLLAFDPWLAARSSVPPLFPWSRRRKVALG
jgi:hypothetical protein